MSKSAKKPSVRPSTKPAFASKSSQQSAADPKSKQADPDSKQSRVIAMLRSPAGATIASMREATGWQQHSVRGFLAGVVRKRLKLKLGSKKVDGAASIRSQAALAASQSQAGPRNDRAEASCRVRR
jgi:hypothetical protein